MRIGYSEEEDYPGQFNLWQANCARSLSGKKGQSALRELEAALLALPTKRLIAHKLDTGAECCAIGALARHKGYAVEIDTPEYDDWGDDDYGTEEVGVALGMPRLVAWKVVEWNDIDLSHVTPEERYERVLKSVQRSLSAGPPNNRNKSEWVTRVAHRMAT